MVAVTFSMSCCLKWPWPLRVLPRGPGTGPGTTQEGVQLVCKVPSRGPCRGGPWALEGGARRGQGRRRGRLGRHWREGGQRAWVRLAVGWPEVGPPSPEAPAWQESKGSACRGRWAGARALEESPRFCDEGAWPTLGTAVWQDEPLQSHRSASKRNSKPRLWSRARARVATRSRLQGEAHIQREGTSLWTKLRQRHISDTGDDLSGALS